MRIVSLLPSATEILFDLGLGDDVVGVTFECNWPAEARTKRIVSTSALPEGLSPGEIDAVVKERMAAGEDLYRLDRGAFADIDPELVVTQDLCAVCAVDVSEVDDALAFLGCSATVVTLDPMTLDEVIDSVTTVGAATCDRHHGAGGRDRRVVAGPGRRAPRAGRRGATSEGARARVDRSGVHGRALGPRPRRRGGRRQRAVVPGGKSQGVEWAAIRDAEADVVIVSPCGFGLDGAADLAAGVIARDLVPPGLLPCGRSTPTP
jgi:iron complex transport system substrate-binding protein